MLTFATWPKPFEGRTGMRQRAALGSWTRLRPPCQILLFGNDIGVADAAAELGVEHVPTVARNEFGTALLDDLMATSRERSQYPLICLANADVVFGDDLLSAVERLSENGAFLMIGRCTDIDDEHAEEPLAELRKRAQGAPLRDAGALDFFVFPSSLYEEIPPFALGRAGFDNWLVWRARDLGARVVDATAAVTAIHLRHDYDHVSGGRAWSYAGDEARRNIKLAGGWLHLYNVDDASHRLLADGLRRNWPALLRTFAPVRRLRLWAGALRRGRAAPEGTLAP